MTLKTTPTFESYIEGILTNPSRTKEAEANQEAESNQDVEVANQGTEANQEAKMSNQGGESNQDVEVATQGTEANQEAKMSNQGGESNQEAESNQGAGMANQDVDSNQGAGMANQDVDSNQGAGMASQDVDSNQGAGMASQDVESNQGAGMASQDVDSKQEAESNQGGESNQGADANQEADANQGVKSNQDDKVVVKETECAVKWLEHLYEPSEASKASAKRLYQVCKHFIYLIDVGGFCDTWRESQWGYYFMGCVDTLVEALKHANNFGDQVEDDEEQAVLQKLYDEGAEDVYDDDSDFNELLESLEEKGMVEAKAYLQKLIARKQPFFTSNAVRLYDSLDLLHHLIVDDNGRHHRFRTTILPKKVLDDAEEALKEAQDVGIHRVKRMYEFL